MICVETVLTHLACLVGFHAGILHSLPLSRLEVEIVELYWLVLKVSQCDSCLCTAGSWWHSTVSSHSCRDPYWQDVFPAMVTGLCNQHDVLKLQVYEFVLNNLPATIGNSTHTLMNPKCITPNPPSPQTQQTHTHPPLHPSKGLNSSGAESCYYCCNTKLVFKSSTIFVSVEIPDDQLKLRTPSGKAQLRRQTNAHTLNALGSI
jgi:hypothetical protein